LLAVFDDAYLERLKAHDRETESHLVQFFTKPLRLKLGAKLRAPELVEEGCQETFLRVLTHFRSGKGIESAGRLPAFVFGVSHNVALELFRARRRYDQVAEEGPDLPDFRNPEIQASVEEMRAVVAKVLSEMPPTDRKILRLVLLEEEDRDQVCRKMGVNRGYLRVLLHRAKHRFKEVLTIGAGTETSSARFRL
jgi:RNA polymerase sigma-70 factor (ECF subfamily)